MSNKLPYSSSAEAEVDFANEPAVKNLDAEAELRSARVQRATLTNSLRRQAFSHAIAVVGGMALLLFVLLLLIFLEHDFTTISDTAQVALFGGPILSITIITVFVLRGVFLAGVVDAKDDEKSFLSPVVRALGD
ncbi:hypothetical protein [Pseudooctadecabacter jejudonensis]|uniref:hypothetical protein n=1 Tax=Pseudooctadecabacter jejudonensis TaxID=1391910 RepID=UPI00117B548C|nr:hypothetical protein [Pseudooctadecabacter jejudonensis]